MTATTEAPAVTIRRAAAKLRELATAASTGSKGEPTTIWAAQYRINEVTREEQRDRGCRLYAVDNADEFGRGKTPLLHGPSGGPGGRGPGPTMLPQHAAYIAAMDPGVGRLLADLLDDTADGIETSSEEYAFKIAQQILGESPC